MPTGRRARDPHRFCCADPVTRARLTFREMQGTAIEARAATPNPQRPPGVNPTQHAANLLSQELPPPPHPPPPPLLLPPPQPLLPPPQPPELPESPPPESPASQDDELGPPIHPNPRRGVRLGRLVTNSTNPAIPPMMRTVIRKTSSRASIQDPPPPQLLPPPPQLLPPPPQLLLLPPPQLLPLPPSCPCPCP